jgi:UDP-N-acetylglucosamine--N-acetylmuramyl-(pentapeptide) pyrophosphoryl-undecaprenol N-acetylglucosamine transferase
MRSLLVASAGGHLEELWMLRARMTGLGDDVVWVTWDTPYSRSLLEGEHRIAVHGTGPRDLVGAARYAVQARRILAQGEWMSVVSTGALVGLPFLAVARAQGIGAHFIESTARVDEPSLTGRLLERVPGVHRYSQYQRSYSDRSRGWIHRGSVFDSFAPGPLRTGPVRSVVVTVGTNQFSFRRLVERVAAIVPPGVHVVWQTGSTDTSGLDIDSQVLIPAENLAGAMRHADLVIAHAGAGSAISAMRAGHRPVLVPRRSLHHEHVDDHQAQIAAELGRQGLATPLEVDDLSWVGLTTARQQVTQPSSAAMFALVEGGTSSPIRPPDRRRSWAVGRPHSRAAS